MFTLLFLVLSAACELLVYSVPTEEKRLRRALALAAGYVIVFTTIVFVLMGGFTAWMLAFVNLYRLFNMGRVLKHRLHDTYLARVTRRTSVMLIGIQLALWLLAFAVSHIHISIRSGLTLLLILQLVLAVIMFGAVRRHAGRMRAAYNLPPVHDSDLPPVTVAIPARNETEDLEACLRSVIASQYPKLEIVVLDDCSQMKRTPEIIRQFAHDGVRFIMGREPQDGWLAKNQAYHALADDANGEIILFAGVDVRFGPNSIRRLVQYMVAKQKNMLCVMPQNQPLERSLPLIQPMRYAWEVALPRRAFDRPPVLSTCWLITKKALEQAGGFKAVSNMMVPEIYLAKQQLKDDGYSFLASGPYYALTSVKSILEQRATVIRTAYPLLHKRPETVALLAIAYIGWIALPAASLIAFIITQSNFVTFSLAVLICLLNGVTYDTVWRLAYGRHSLIGSFSLPVATLIYLTLVHYSMYKYEFSDVLWKGRNVCLPVMHVVPHLPPLSQPTAGPGNKS